MLAVIGLPIPSFWFPVSSGESLLTGMSMSLPHVFTRWLLILLGQWTFGASASGTFASMLKYKAVSTFTDIFHCQSLIHHRECSGASCNATDIKWLFYICLGIWALQLLNLYSLNQCAYIWVYQDGNNNSKGPQVKGPCVHHEHKVVAGHCVFSVKPAYQDPSPLSFPMASVCYRRHHIVPGTGSLNNKMPLLPLFWRLGGVPRVGFFWGLFFLHRWLPSPCILMCLSHVSAHPRISAYSELLLSKRHSSDWITSEAL